MGSTRPAAAGFALLFVLAGCDGGEPRHKLRRTFWEGPADETTERHRALGEEGSMGNPNSHAARVVMSGEWRSEVISGAPPPGRGKPASVRMGASEVTGRLPPEVIQRTVRASFGKLRKCYENTLRDNPPDHSHVSIEFTISRTGSVSNARVHDPDAALATCMVDVVRGLSFPEPQGGVVRVTYPVGFQPGR